MYLARLTARNGTTVYVGRNGGLTPDRDQADRFFTRRAALSAAMPRANGIPELRAAALGIRGCADPA